MILNDLKNADIIIFGSGLAAYCTGKNLVYSNKKVLFLERRTFIKLFSLLNLIFYSNISLSNYKKENKLTFSKFKGFIVTFKQKKFLYKT